MDNETNSVNTARMDRMKRYCKRRDKARGLDKENIHGFDLGEDSEAILLLSDIKGLIDLHEKVVDTMVKLKIICETELTVHKRDIDLLAELLGTAQQYTIFDTFNKPLIERVKGALK